MRLELDDALQKLADLGGSTRVSAQRDDVRASG